MKALVFLAWMACIPGAAFAQAAIGVCSSKPQAPLSSRKLELPSRTVEVTYTRRTYNGFFVADNLALQPSDLTPYSIVAPVDPRLPGGGGYVVSGLYDAVPAKSGHVDNLVGNADRYGAWSQSFNGVDVTAHVRLGNRFVLVGGASTGQTVADNCDVRARLPELATTTTGTSAFGAGLNASAVTPVSPYCHADYGWLAQARGLTSYVVPKADVELSATFQSKPGAMLAANYAAPNSAVAPSLGAVLSYNNAYVPGGTWLQPMTILTPRLLRLSAEVDC